MGSAVLPRRQRRQPGEAQRAPAAGERRKPATLLLKAASRTLRRSRKAQPRYQGPAPGRSCPAASPPATAPGPGGVRAPVLCEGPAYRQLIGCLRTTLKAPVRLIGWARTAQCVVGVVVCFGLPTVRWCARVLRFPSAFAGRARLLGGGARPSGSPALLAVRLIGTGRGRVLGVDWLVRTDELYLKSVNGGRRRCPRRAVAALR